MPRKMTNPGTVAGYPLVFEWEGGEYIEVRFQGDEYSFDVINTTDADGNVLEFTRENFTREVREYIRNPEADHAHDLREYALAR